MKPRVLVVDDDRLVADTLSMIFQANGFESEAAYTAADALRFARARRPALLLCDVTMPEEDGLELVQQIHTELPGCHVLMLSAYAANAQGVEQQSRRMKRPLKLLNKPCRPEDLLHEARTLLCPA